MRIIFSDPGLFFKKAIILFLATLALVPLIHYKLIIPAIYYISGLLILHLFFFYLYFSKVPWREIFKNKKGLTIRFIGVAFLIYLLTILKFEGNPTIILLNIFLAFIIHILILSFMMVIKFNFSER